MRHVFAFPLVLGFVWVVAHPASSNTLALKLQNAKTPHGDEGGKDEGEEDDDSLVFKPTVPEKEPDAEKKGEHSVVRAFWKNMTKKQAKANREILQKRRDKEQPDRVQIKGKGRKDTVIRGLEKFEKHLTRKGKDVSAEKLEEKGKKALREIISKSKATSKVTGNQLRKYEEERWNGYSKGLDSVSMKASCKVKKAVVDIMVNIANLYKESLVQKEEEGAAKKRKEGFYLRFHHPPETTNAEKFFWDKTKSMLLKCKL